MVLTTCSPSPAWVTLYHLFECHFRMHFFCSLHTPSLSPFSLCHFIFLQVNSWCCGNLVLIFRPNNNSAGLTPVVECGVLRYIIKKSSICDLQSRPSAWAMRKRFRLERFCLSISSLACGYKGVVCLCSIPFSSRYPLTWSLTNSGPFSGLKEQGSEWQTSWTLVVQSSQRLMTW